MNSDFSEIFAASVEKLEQGTMTLDEVLALYPEFRDELEPLLRTVDLIQQNPYQIRPEFKNNSPDQLIKALPPHQNKSTSFSHLKTRKNIITNPAWGLSLFIGFFCILLFASGTVYASSHSLPGDILFPVKLAVEDFRLSIANDEKDMQLQTEFLQTRLDEIDQLIEQQRNDDLILADNYYQETLEMATTILTKNSTNEQSDNNKVDDYQDFLSKQTEIITELLDSVPEPAQPALQSILDKTKKNNAITDEIIPTEDLPDDKEKKPDKSEITSTSFVPSPSITETLEPTVKTNNGNVDTVKDKNSDPNKEKTPGPPEKEKPKNPNVPTKKTK